MKSFSPAGMAIKAFLGLGARTFGNPSGARSGDGGTTGQADAWNVVFHGFQAGSGPSSVAVLDQQRAVVGCSTTGEIVYTVDSGTTWTTANQVANPRGFVAEFAYNGTVLVCYGADTTNNPQLCRSVDGGVTWDDVTPVNPNFQFAEFGNATFLCVQWSQSIQKFVCFASSALGLTLTCFTSHDGTLWAGHTLPLSSMLLGAFRAANNGKIVAVGFAVAPEPSAAVIQLSNDGGITWQIVLNDPGVRFVDAVEFNNISWVAVGDTGGTAFNYSSVDAVTWTLENTVPSDTVPPYFDTLATLNGQFVVAANSTASPTSAFFGVSLNGVSWVQVSVPNNVFNVLTKSGTLYGIGTGISVSVDGIQWSSQLDQSGPVDNLDVFGVSASGPQTQPGFLGLAVGNDSSNNPTIWRFGPALPAQTTLTATLAFNSHGPFNAPPNPGNAYQPGFGSVGNTPSGNAAGTGAPDPAFVNGAVVSAVGNIGNGFNDIVTVALVGTLPQNHFTNVVFVDQNSVTYTLNTASAGFNSIYSEPGYSIWTWQPAMFPTFANPTVFTFNW